MQLMGERAALKAAEKRAKDIIAKLPNPTFLTDPRGNILLSNTATPLSMGLSLGEFLQTNVKDCVEKGYYDISVALEAAETRHRVSKVLTTRLGMTFVSTSTPIFDDDGKIKLTCTNATPIREFEKTVAKMSDDEHEHRRRRIEYLFGHVFGGTEVVAESEQMRKLMVMADALARTDSTVMITGETGTGKDVVARYIHSRSRRANAPFITVNAAALPDNLVEAELFGYERGAFTGARSDGYGGLFAAAHGGTLFLDEVAELSLPVQAKLLRVLESGEVRRVGGALPHKVDVRLITATHRNLDEMVRERLFRADLFYRLDVLSVNIPPLRERREDIPGLAMRFARDICAKYECDVQIDPVTLHSLTTREWPGNARELRNFVERYIFNVQANLGGIEELAAIKSQVDETDLLNLVEIGSPLKNVLSQVEENYVRYMLDVCGGRIGLTASRLGIYRTALHRKLKAYRTRLTGIS